MKKIAFLMALVMMMTCIIPALTPTDVSAAANPWSGWTRSNATVDGSVLTMNSSSYVEKVHTIPSDYVAKFSMKIFRSSPETSRR